MRTRSLGFLSFAHQEGDLGFVELRLALHVSGSAASVTVEPTRFLLKQVKRGFTLSQYSLKSVRPSFEFVCSVEVK